MSVKQLKKEDLRGFTLTKSNTYENEGNYLAWVNLFYGERLTYDTNRKVAMLDGNEINGLMMNDLLKDAAETRTVKDELGGWKTLGFTKISRMKKAVIEVAKLHEVDTTDRIRDEITREYGEHLSFNVIKNVVCYDGKNDKLKVKMLVESIKSAYKIKSTQARMLVEDVAREKKFKDVLVSDAMTDNDEGINAENWEDFLETEINENGEGKLKHSISNYVLFLLYSPKYHNRLKFNLFNKNEYYIDENGVETFIDDTIVSQMKQDIEDYFGDYKNNKAEDAINVALKKRSYNPVIDLHNECRKIEVDGCEEAETLFIKFLGAKDTPLNRKMTGMGFIGSICRVEQETPTKGFDFDFMTILDGPQGIGKSKLIERMYGSEYTQTSIDITDEQDYVDKCNSARVGMIDEMSKFGNKSLEDIKDFITKTGNRVRLPYARRSQYYPRHTVFYGSTNKECYLRDYDTDYERRFLIIECFGKPHSRAWWEENLTDDFIKNVWAQWLKIYDSGEYKKYLELTEEEIEELKQIQLRKKTFNENETLKEDINIILNNKYPAAYCEDYDTWASVYDRWKGVEGTTQVNEIPSAWVAKRLGEVTKKTQSTQFLRPIVNVLGWEYVKNGTRAYRNYPVYRRKTPIFISKPEEIVSNEAKKTSPLTITINRGMESNPIF